MRFSFRCGAALLGIGSICSITLMTVSVAIAADAPPAPELVARMDKEKAARRACKLEICNAFATPAAGAPITCDVTKTWLRNEITAKLVGGSTVWGYGNAQCTMKLNLDRGLIAKTMTDAKAEAKFAEHTLACNVDQKDSAEQAFSVKISLTPVASFENGQAKSVSLEPVKTDGSTLASAAVGSVMALDKISGTVSRTMASEVNDFLFIKCKDDGVTIVKK